MHWGFFYIQLLLLLTIGVTQGSHFSRDESSEADQTEFNLASTLKGGISSNRHHARAHLNSQLYPEITQLPSQQPSAGYVSADIDEPSAHESGGSGIGTLDVHVGPAPGNRVIAPGNRVVAPGNRVVPTDNQNGVASIYPALPVGGAPAYPAPTPGVAFHIPNPNLYPGYPYPGQYLPQYPIYPQRAPFAGYPDYTGPQPGYPGPQPGYPGPPPSPPNYPHPMPPLSYQNQQHFAPSQPLPGQREHFDHSFTMNTEYKEDGVHKGPFGLLNNRNGQGYGSGFGGGYNGAYNRPGY
ncbi:calcium-binding protein P [Drosophila innubila]|uniref:calcium-binding protein P n=1 Tax=Drosophila innubila TaxID=198719 RepID=UPI00148BAC62|nr:calcium-binding protein P [Drosophila innubila]